MRARDINYVVTLGVELEGGWDCECDGAACNSSTPCPRQECSLCDDPDCGCHGSHTCYREDDCDDDGEGMPPRCLRRRLFPEASPRGDGSVSTGARWDGEIACGPFKVDSDWIDKISSIWPSKVNQTCGMHVHMGMRNDDIYARFMTPHFETFLLDGLRQWGERQNVSNQNFWNRLNGENSFCRLGWVGDYTASDPNKSDERYHVCNYTWRHKGTLEIRVLPMFKSAPLATRAICEVLRLSNAWARQNRKRQRASVVCAWDDEMVSAVSHHEANLVETMDWTPDDISTHRMEDLFTCA